MTNLTVDDDTGPKASLASQIIPPTRYRDPGDVLHLLASAAVLLVAVVMVAIFPDQLLGSHASVVSGAEPDTEAGRLLVGVVQVLAVGFRGRTGRLSVVAAQVSAPPHPAAGCPHCRPGNDRADASPRPRSAA